MYHDQPKFKAAIILMSRPHFMDEFQEWLDWHSFVGFEHFFVYDDSDGRSLTKRFGSDPRITFCNWVERMPNAGEKELGTIQAEYLSRINLRVRDACEWVAFTDDDEYIVPSKNNLREILDNLKVQNVCGLELHSRVFGTGDHETKPDGLVAEEYSFWHPSRVRKTICQPSKIDTIQGLHSLKYHSNQKAILTNGEVVDDSKKECDPVYESIWFNHYVVKSHEHFNLKLERGCCNKKILGKTEGGRFKYGSKFGNLRLEWLSNNHERMSKFSWERETDDLLHRFKKWREYDV